MLKEIIDGIELVSPTLNFVSSFLIFLAGGYIAMHSRIMPRWAVTCLWYVGLFSLLNAITFIVDWTLGQMHPLSHFQIGHTTEALVSCAFAAMVCLLFFHTVWQDYLGAKRRRLSEENMKKVPAKRTTNSKKRPAKKLTVLMKKKSDDRLIL